MSIIRVKRQAKQPFTDKPNKSYFRHEKASHKILSIYVIKFVEIILKLLLKKSFSIELLIRYISKFFILKISSNFLRDWHFTIMCLTILLLFRIQIYFTITCWSPLLYNFLNNSLFDFYLHILAYE